MYLTKKRKREIIRGVWQMRLGQIDLALSALARKSPRNRQLLLLAALRAACVAKLEGAMLSIGQAYLTEFRTIPPACYWLGDAKNEIHFPGERLNRRVTISTVNLGLVHPQVYR